MPRPFVFFGQGRGVGVKGKGFLVWQTWDGLGSCTGVLSLHTEVYSVIYDSGSVFLEEPSSFLVKTSKKILRPTNSESITRRLSSCSSPSRCSLTGELI